MRPSGDPMLIEIREPSGMVSRLTVDPSTRFWAFVASLEAKFPTATFRLVVSR